MSVINDEMLIINFDENENSTILYYSDENNNIYTRGFIHKGSSKIGAGGIVAIILACIAVMAALIITYFCCKKVNKIVKADETKESTVLQLKN